MGFFKKLFGKKDKFYDSVILLLSDFRIVGSDFASSSLGLSATMNGPTLIVSGPGYHFKVISAPIPYGPGGKEKVAKYFGEYRSRTAYEAHKAFINVYMDADTPPELRQSRKLKMVEFVAHLIDDSVLLLWETEHGRLNIPTPNVIEALKLGQVDQAFGETEIDPVSITKPSEFDAEIAMAKSTFSTFLERWPTGNSEDLHMIKFGFTEPGSLDKEYMWVMPHSINGDLVVGTLENAPVSLRTYRESQTVEMPISSMVDWISVIGEDMQGGFCERKLRGIR